MDTTAKLKRIFPGNSEMAQRMRDFDWPKNELGPPENWPETLKTSIRIILTSRHPMLIWWGNNFLSLYNDGYAIFLHSKHPDALGKPASIVWSEIWDDIIVPRVEFAKYQDRGIFDETMQLVNIRCGYPEITYATFSYSPILDDDGQFGGFLIPVTEETQRILNQRQMMLLRQLAAKTLGAGTRKEAYALMVDALQTDTDDIPFALIYEVNVKTGIISLEAAIGVSPKSLAMLKTPTLDNDSVWPLKDVFTKNSSIIVSNLNALSEHLPLVLNKYSISQAAILPLTLNVDDIKGVLIIGANPLRPLDDNYQDFLYLISVGVSSAIQKANADEAQMHRAAVLAELDRAKTAFFSNVSHEFRTPLALILGSLENVLAENKDPKQQKSLDLMHRNVLRLQKLVNNLLDFSRIEADCMQVSYEPTVLAEFTAELASIFRSTIEKAGIRLIIDCEPLDDLVYIDRDMYEKIFFNLLSNAFKFTMEGEITVMLRDAESAVELSIKDTGVGISEAELPYVFERFHRNEDMPARTHEGTGIDLALVQELVNLHGGFIEVKSVRLEGSTFTISILKGFAHLPKDMIAAARQLTSTMLTAEHYLEEALSWVPDRVMSVVSDSVNTDVYQVETSDNLRPRIVWAGDNTDMRDYVSHILSSRYEVEAVPDGKAALAVVYRRPSDLILADVMMPLLDGFGLLSAIRGDKNLRLIPLILLSAHAGEEGRIEGMAAGANEYLVKPFSARELVAMIDAQLLMGRMRAENEKTLRETRAMQTHELEEMKQLQKVSSFLIEDESVEKLYQQILDAAMVIMRSDFSSIQLLDAEQSQLCLLGWKNFHPASAEYWQKVSIKTGTTCGSALKHGERIFVPDVNDPHSLIEGESLRHYNLSGITAVQSTPLTTREGRIIGMISTHWRERHEPSERELTLFDVLARQTADVLERRRVQDKLKETDRRKDEFLAVLAHELRNPLFPIKNAIHLMQNTRDGTYSQQLLQIMERQINHIVRLVDDLLEVSRIATGKIELEKETISLVEVINNAIEVSKPCLDNRQHKLTLLLPAESLMINADMIRMTQVFANLLNNAAKYTPKNGSILIHAFLENNHAVITVRDNGIGISAKMLPKIFEMFIQDKQSMDDPNSRGLGIGLAMVRSLVELHEGTVKAQSAGHNQGSEFIVRLPGGTTNRKEIKNKNMIPSEKKYFLANLRILIVDDSSDIIESFAMLLSSWEVKVHAVNNGKSALAVLDKFEPHIILLDIGMSDMDGYEVATRIRQNPKYDSIKLVALTGWSQEKDRVKSRAHGFNEHLAKPVDFNELRKVLIDE